MFDYFPAFDKNTCKKKQKNKKQKQNMAICNKLILFGSWLQGSEQDASCWRSYK
uniref:Uncharacterized protein n=1 Tax=Anguilla anguilla TaxID=7936 RepID=A0A0E9PEQ9_ANGAN